MRPYSEIAKELLPINEDVEQNREYREIARKIYEKLKSALEDGKNNILNKAKNGYFVDGNVIGHSAFIFYFAPEDHTSGYKKHKDYHMIKIPVLPEDGSPENIEFRLHEMKKTIVHEIVHALDNMRFGKEMEDFYSSEDLGTKKYFNKPNELNAYYQGAVNELEEFIEDMTPHEFETYKDSFKDFQNFKEWAFDLFFEKEFLDALNKKNRRKIVKRLSKYFQKIEKEGKLNKNRYE